MAIRQDGRVIAYIDGHNTYHGLVDKGFRRYLWLDYLALIRRKILPDQTLVAVKYFTSVVNVPQVKRQRHQLYLRALKEHCGLEPITGFFQREPTTCTKCNATFKRPVEKQTDVALATHLVADAVGGRTDLAFLVSGDADQVPAVVQAREAGIEVAVWSPPRRKSDELVAVADAHLHFNARDLRQSQLPNPVSTRKGKELWRPPEWT